MCPDGEQVRGTADDCERASEKAKQIRFNNEKVPKTPIRPICFDVFAFVTVPAEGHGCCDVGMFSKHGAIRLIFAHDPSRNGTTIIYVTPTITP